jgi:hypothetical protein
MKGVFDLQSLESCVAYADPPLLVLVVGSDCEMRLQAPTAAEAKAWLKCFLIASPNCRVSFKQGSKSGFGTPSPGVRQLDDSPGGPALTTRGLDSTATDGSSVAASSAAAAVAGASIKKR